MSSGFKGEPVGGLLGVVVDEDGGTVPSAVGLVVVVSDEMPDELMVSAFFLSRFIVDLQIFWPIRMFYEMGGYIFRLFGSAIHNALKSGKSAI